MTRAECLMVAGGLRAALGDATATGGVGEDSGEDTGAGIGPGCAAPFATAAGLPAEVVAGAPHAATPPAARAMVAPPSASGRIHGMNPLSLPPGATVAV